MDSDMISAIATTLPEDVREHTDAAYLLLWYARARLVEDRRQDGCPDAFRDVAIQRLDTAVKSLDWINEGRLAQ